MNKDFTIVDKTVLLVGKRNSGKSVLLKNMVSYYGKSFSKIYACSGTEAVNKYYTNCGLIRSDCVFDTYNEEWGQNLIKALISANSGLEKSKQRKVLLILDDCIADVNFHNAKSSITHMFANGRHYGISLIVTTQYLKSVSPLMRGNSDFAFIGQQNSESLKILGNTYMSGKITKSQFYDLYDKSTLDYNFFAINCNSVKNRDNINELYGVIKAPPEKYKTIIETVKRNDKKEDDKKDIWDSIFSSNEVDDTTHETVITIKKRVLIPIRPFIRDVA